MNSSHPDMTARRITQREFAETRGVVETLEDADARASETISAAKREATAIIDAARAEIAALRIQAEAAAEPEIRAYVAAQKEARLAAALLKSSDLARDLRDDFDASGRWLGDLVMRSITTILGEIDVDDIVMGIIQKAMDDTRNRWQLDLRVSPTALGRVRHLVGGHPDLFEGLENILPDATLAGDEMTLVSGGGLSDISLTVQLATLEATIADALRGGSDDA